MVVVYAFGVERGKTAVPAVPATKSAIPVPVVQKPVMISVKAPAQTKPALPVSKASPQVNMPVQDTAKPYTIVAATFRNSQTASQEMARVKKQGLDAYIGTSDAYFQVCVGAYPDKDSVQSKKALTKVRQFYKDAYFKLR